MPFLQLGSTVAWWDGVPYLPDVPGLETDTRGACLTGRRCGHNDNGSADCPTLELAEGSICARGAMTTRRRRSRRSRAARALDERFILAPPIRRVFNAVFPDSWSLMLGEIALYCFAILIVTGTYLTFYYDPSRVETPYGGPYVPLRGIDMSQAYSSTMRISFDVRGGLLIRQIHHWAALLFMAAVLLHLCRTFFSGAFRKPRDLNWLLGVVILMVCLLEGFSGYTLPDDIISGASIHIAEAIMLSLPLIGTWVVFAIFEGEYPGHILERLYVVHIFIGPALLLALIGMHLGLVVRQKHTQPPASKAIVGKAVGSQTAVPPGRRTVAGVRVLPARLVRSGALFLMVAGVLAGLGGLAQINPIWLYGPYEPAFVSSNSQPDWYTFFLEGALRFFPGWEIRAWGHTVPAVFWPGAVLPTVMFLLVASYPWLEARITRDRGRHDRSQRARDAPVRSAIGAAGLTFYLVLALGAVDDMAAKTFDLTIETVVWIGRVSLIVAPIIAAVITLRTCHLLQAHDRERRRIGRRTGIVLRNADGDWSEVVTSTLDGADEEPTDGPRRSSEHSLGVGAERRGSD